MVIACFIHSIFLCCLVRHVITVERSDTVVCAFSGCEPSWSLVGLVDPLGLEKMETCTLSKHINAKPGSLGVWKGTPTIELVSWGKRGSSGVCMCR